MFDGLKDKLGSFRSEAEEAAEENAEVVDEDADVDEEADVDEAADAEGDADVEEAAGAVDDGDATAPDAADAPDDAYAGEPLDSGGEAVHPDDVEPDASGSAAAESDEPSEAGDDTDDAEPSADDPADRFDGERLDSGGEAVHPDDVDAEAYGEDEPSEDDDEPSADADDADADDAANTSFARKAKSFTRGRFVIEEDDLEGPLEDLEMALLASDVELSVVDALTDSIREELVGETRTFTTGTGAVVEDALESALLDVIGVGQFDFEQRIAEADKPVVIIFTGVNGVGKTTSIAKLSEYLAERGHDSVLANGDTFRAGANEQIEEHADALDRKLIAHEQGGDPAAVIYDAVEYAKANGVDVVLGDTAGRLHTSEGLMDQLAKIDRVVDPDVTLFVDEAVAGQDAVNRAREFDASASIDGTILTKADADSSGGAAISIAHVTGKPILFLGTGQGYDDLERFDPEWMVEQLLGEE